MRQLGVLILVLFLAACGGGGGGASPAPAPPPPVVPPPAPPPEATRAQIIDASKFTSRATFGLPYEELEQVALTGHDEWLDQQFALPVGLHTPVVDFLIESRDSGAFAAFENDISYLVQFRRWAWWNCAVTCVDVVRQRVAFALSQILVVSDNVDALIVYPDALSSYQDVLLQHSFGNFRDLLYDVTLHPAMGFYLSHINNSRSNPAQNTFPDENFAREVMQLFSIGLFELNIDGSLRLDGSGNPIPTYDNDDIREFAKVFTGFSFGGANATFGGSDVIDFRSPMKMFDFAHEPGPKNLLNGFVVPEGQTGLKDVSDAIDNLFNHPNVGPFIGKQLIQRLVTSNPSPAYIQRVAEAFNGTATGVRGDMQAVVRAVLTDPEIDAPSDNFGKLREPVVRYLNILRQFNASSESDFIANGGYFFQGVTRQHPMSAPSVFNFYLPQHAPSGEISSEGLVAPEFQITDSSTIINFTNLLDSLALGDVFAETPEPFPSVTLDFTEYDELAEDLDALIDRLDILLAGGNLSAEFRTLMSEVLVELPEIEQRRRVALYMVLTSTDYVIQR